jgi:hypothetical protein
MRENNVQEDGTNCISFWLSFVEFVNHGQHTDAATLEPNYSLLHFSNGLLPLTKVGEYQEGNKFASRLVIKFRP